MALAEVRKINLVAHRGYRDEIFEKLQTLGFIQVEENTDSTLVKENLNQEISDLDYKIAGIKFSLDFLFNYITEKKSLAEKINPLINLTELELWQIMADFDHENIVRQIQQVESGINEANSKLEKASLEINQLNNWQDLNFIPNSKTLPEKINFKLFVVTEDIYQTLTKKLADHFPLSSLERVETANKTVKAALIYNIDFDKEINETLSDLGIKIDELPNIEISIDEQIKKLQAEIDSETNHIETLKKQAGILATETKNLKIASDYLTWQKDQLVARQKTVTSWQTFSLIGWIDKKLIPSLEKELSKITDDYFIEEIQPNEDESVPVIFKNSWASPFEFVTGVYGAPQYGEPDPTPFLAPFFILFFGLCLTDAGYGIILALIAWLGIKILKPAKEAKKMFLVLMYGGIVTFFAGAAVGGWFGIVIDGIQIQWLKNLLVGLRLIDPVKNPISMLIFSLILGVIQMLTGIIISLWWKIKHKDIASAILDDAMWLYFLIVMMVWGATKAGLIEFSAANILVWIGVIGIIATQGRKAKHPILKITNGIISLYGLVGYLSDVLSYSRLLALGLATGIIAMVVNLIAALTVDMIPYLGYVIALFILIGGHAFNIAINALGSFIHSSRLQFVEFFPKFMEGGGVNFIPFKKESQYLKINKN